MGQRNGSVVLSRSVKKEKVKVNLFYDFIVAVPLITLVATKNH